MHSTSIKKIIAGVAAIATAAMGLALAAPAANAADPVGLGNIDTTKDGSLIIHKRKLPAGSTGKPNYSGKEDSSASGSPLGGAHFTVTPVVKTDGSKIDMKANATWENLQSLQLGKNDTVVKGTDTIGKLGTPITSNNATDDTTGELTFSSLPVGIYYVQEVKPYPKGVTTPSQPFFVTIPFPSRDSDTGTSSEWLYDVNVYQKNQTAPATKNVDTNGSSTTKQNIQWDIDVQVPDTPGAVHTAFGFSDFLENGTQYVSISTSTDPAGTTLTEGTDYTVEHLNYNDTGYPTDSHYATYENNHDQYVKVTFTHAGLLKLKKTADQAANDVNTVHFVMTVKFTGDLVNDGTTNKAYKVNNTVYPLTDNNNPFENHQPGVPATKIPYYGNLELKKTDDTKANALGGAHFDLWTQVSGDTNCAQKPTDSNKIISAVSGADGALNFKGILVGTGDPDSDSPTPSSVTVCVVETQAPAGYVLNNKPFTETISTGDNGNLTDPAFEVTNTKEHGPNLPLTGAAGRLLLILGAIVVLAAAATLYVVNKRRQNIKANR